MKTGLRIKNGIVIPEHELTVTTSRSSGPGGQHVQKTSSRVTVRWNVQTTSALNEEQKKRVLGNLGNKITIGGELIIHNSTSRSQLANKQMAFNQLAREVRKALHVPKKRVVTTISKKVKEKRIQEKKQHSVKKKMRSKKKYEE